MAESETLPVEEREFQTVVAHIGGKERIYLVSDACKSNGVDAGDAGILQEFVGDMFHNDNPAISKDQLRCSPQSDTMCESPCKSDTGKCNEIPLTKATSDLRLEVDRGKEQRPTSNNQRTATRRVNIYSTKRAIDSPVIIFIFRQTFISKVPNQVCLKEILKDVKARTKCASITLPALIGLIRTTQESDETRQCAQVLESEMRAVFHKHSPETIWVGCFIPKTEASVLNIKKNACKVVCASQTADNTRDRGDQYLWSFHIILVISFVARPTTNLQTANKKVMLEVPRKGSL
ncbi:uncharacterized protein LOC121653502 [Melanotaenia boesemani]|uniref:uncharacterized protein LOC121653502 n=1 Tax=Melanotaenia boesemani TaxID=1250792 RepID=UPI001C03FABA|nr:uncharacterized protein LOC121653502 [Melanotaenia boesemani]